MKEQVNDLSGVQVGDILWHISKGAVKVLAFHEGVDYKIFVERTRQSFDLAGKTYEDTFPTLFWDKPVFEYPKKPKTVTIREDKFDKAWNENFTLNNNGYNYFKKKARVLV